MWEEKHQRQHQQNHQQKQCLKKHQYQQDHR
jgi:hypothetical protein